MPEDLARRTTFFSKNPTVCPVCETSFYKEELLSGGGRLIAGELTDELHRTYEPSKKFGELHPLIYTAPVCPACCYAALPQDFQEPREETLQVLRNEADRRRDSVGLVLKDLNFADYRRLEEGVASYMLAIMCYEHFDRHAAPSFKRALCALRAAWLLEALHRRRFGENFDYLSRLFYRKARFFYLRAIELAQTGHESLEGGIHFGPDLDKNFGFEGLLYLAGLLEFRYGPREERERRVHSLENAKRIVSKLFGSGKASKAKPSVILDKARDLYDEMNREIKQLQEQGS
jgi:uncharacterized protein (DUF2225 family)